MDKNPFSRSVFKIRLQRSVVKTDPCPYIVKYYYSPAFLKKNTKVLDIFNSDNKMSLPIEIISNICRIKSSRDMDKYTFSCKVVINRFASLVLCKKK